MNKKFLGLEYIKHMMEKSLDTKYFEVFENYEEYHTETLTTGNRQRAEIFASWIKPGSGVLDIGSGDGSNAAYIRDKCKASVEGVDISKNAAKKAEKKGIKVQIVDLNKGLDIDGEFDYILISEVLEHLTKPHIILKDAVKQAKKGVIVSFPNSGWLPYRCQAFRGYTIKQSYTHLHFWSIKDFHKFCQLIDIEIDEFKTIVPDGFIAKALIRGFPNLMAFQSCFLLKGAREDK